MTLSSSVAESLEPASAPGWSETCESCSLRPRICAAGTRPAARRLSGRPALAVAVPSVASASCPNRCSTPAGRIARLLSSGPAARSTSRVRIMRCSANSKVSRPRTGRAESAARSSIRYFLACASSGPAAGSSGAVPTSTSLPFTPPASHSREGKEPRSPSTVPCSPPAERTIAGASKPPQGRSPQPPSSMPPAILSPQAPHRRPASSRPPRSSRRAVRHRPSRKLLFQGRGRQ